MAFYGGYYRFGRWLVKTFGPTYTLVHPERLMEPAVYLCRHRKNSGILTTLPWLPGRVRTWALDVFFDYRSCYRHVRDITYVQVLGWPRFLAVIPAFFSALLFPPLIRAGRCIPVHRASRRIIRTFSESSRALEAGDCLMIYPDKEYNNTSDDLSELYEGFLLLERYVFRLRACHVPFIPLYTDPTTHTLHIGRPVYFQADGRDPEERKRMLQLIHDALSGKAIDD